MQHCIKQLINYSLAGRDPYELIDKPLPAVSRIAASTSMSTPWDASFNRSRVSTLINNTYPQEAFHLGAAEWLVPSGYRPRDGERRLVFIHGGQANYPAVAKVRCVDGTVGCEYYSGLTTRLAHATRLPVFAMDYATE